MFGDDKKKQLTAAALLSEYIINEQSTHFILRGAIVYVFNFSYRLASL